MLGLYVHIPFCASICNYCNFNRGLFESGLKDRYLRALEQEILRAGHGEPADTVFFGGGTPSLLEPAEIARVIEACRRTFDVTGNAEITLETNPETSSAERMAGYREAGVNRISFGVQSFRDSELKRLGRLHSAERARVAVAEARAGGLDNVSLDLMMWLPQQSREDWIDSVGQLIDVGPEHASLYLLELYPNAPLKEEMARAGWSLAPDDDAAEMYLGGLAALDRAGYEQYRDIERRARRSCVAPQSQILDRRRMARIRVRRALHARRRPLEECREHHGLCRSVGCGAARGGRDSRDDAGGASRGRPVHWTAAHRGR